MLERDGSLEEVGALKRRFTFPCKYEAFSTTTLRIVRYYRSCADFAAATLFENVREEAPQSQNVANSVEQLQ